MNKTWNWSLTVALAGFLFGFDTVVISGANAPIKELVANLSLVSRRFHHVDGAMGDGFGLVSEVVMPTKRSLGSQEYADLAWGYLYLVSALGSGLSRPDPYLFSFFRFLGWCRRWRLHCGRSYLHFRNQFTAKNRGRLVAVYTNSTSSSEFSSPSYI